MKQLLLAFQLLKTNWKSYIVLVLQLVISMLLFTILCCTLRYYGHADSVVRPAMDQNALMFSPFMSEGSFMSQQGETEANWKGVVQEFSKTKPVETDGFFHLSASLHEIDARYTPYQIFAYTDSMVKRGGVPLSEGEWFTQEKLPDGSVPAVLMNPGKFKCGDRFTMEMKQGEVCPVTVVGVKQTPAYYYTVDGFTKSYSICAAKAQIPTFILPLDLFPKQAITEGVGMLYHLASPEAAQQLKAQLEDHGYVYGGQDLIEEYEKDLHSDITNNTVMFTLFSLLTFAGFCGINGLQDRKNRRKFAAYYMTGQTKKQAAGIEALRSGLVLAVSCALYAVIFNLFSSGAIQYPNVNEYMDVWTGAAVVGFAFVLYLASSLPFIIRAAKRSPVEQIREWGE